MSDKIFRTDKRIFKNKPTYNANGQYNVGRISSGNRDTIFGIPQDNIINEESDLYTSVIHKDDINLIQKEAE